MSAFIFSYEYEFIFPFRRAIFILFVETMSSKSLAEISKVSLEIFNLFPLIENGSNIVLDCPCDDFNESISRMLSDIYLLVIDSIRLMPIFKFGIKINSFFLSSLTCNCSIIKNGSSRFLFDEIDFILIE